MHVLIISYQSLKSMALSPAVFFRKHTTEQATALGLRGWVQNTEHGTVIGELEGPPAKVEEMKGWLAKTGSPKSVIKKAVFSDERSVDRYSFEAGFDFKR